MRKEKNEMFREDGPQHAAEGLCGGESRIYGFPRVTTKNRQSVTSALAQEASQACYRCIEYQLRSED